MERDTQQVQERQLYLISTHTLTWSVTNRKQFETLVNTISTHTLTWSVTILTWKRLKNSIISTHTLTWSVTLGNCVG